MLFAYSAMQAAGARKPTLTWDCAGDVGYAPNLGSLYTRRANTKSASQITLLHSSAQNGGTLCREIRSVAADAEVSVAAPEPARCRALPLAGHAELAQNGDVVSQTGDSE